VSESDTRLNTDPDETHINFFMAFSRTVLRRIMEFLKFDVVRKASLYFTHLFSLILTLVCPNNKQKSTRQLPSALNAAGQLHWWSTSWTLCGPWAASNYAATLDDLTSLVLSYWNCKTLALACAVIWTEWGEGRGWVCCIISRTSINSKRRGIISVRLKLFI
jgi:hypothetical protein